MIFRKLPNNNLTASISYHNYAAVPNTATIYIETLTRRKFNDGKYGIVVGCDTFLQAICTMSFLLPMQLLTKKRNKMWEKKHQVAK